MKQLPFSVNTERKILHHAESWCREKWGPRWNVIDNREGTWCVFWGGNRTIPSQYQWHFKTEQQLMIFMLRWV